MTDLTKQEAYEKYESALQTSAGLICTIFFAAKTKGFDTPQESIDKLWKDTTDVSTEIIRTAAKKFGAFFDKLDFIAEIERVAGIRLKKADPLWTCLVVLHLTSFFNKMTLGGVYDEDATSTDEGAT
jgi:hypothetical protein